MPICPCIMSGRTRKKTSGADGTTAIVSSDKGVYVSAMLNPHLNRLTDYPFDRLRALLDGISPVANVEPLVLSIGEPQHEPPAMIAREIANSAHLWGRYPPIDGTPDFRAAVAGWLNRRFELPDGLIDADRQILPVSGTREALFLAAMLSVPRRKKTRRPAVLLPNPMYHVYAGAGQMAGADVVPLATTKAGNFLPDLDAISPETLSRTALMYLCTPSNPQGTVAGPAYLKKAILLARTHDFVLAMDECYSEIYDVAPPPGAAQACRDLGGDFSNVMIFHSLSKRSSAPGLRSGFVTGDADLLEQFRRLRNFGGATMPMPIMAASAALWRDDDHVERNRALYRVKFDSAERLFGGDQKFYRPAAGFFLWLDVGRYGGGERVARKLWAEAALRVLPGAYLSRPAASGGSPGDAYIRIALVHAPETTRNALERIVKVLR